MRHVVRYRSAAQDDFEEGYSHNLSQGGIFIASSRCHPVGTELGLEVQAADGSALLCGKGVVRWIREHAPDRRQVGGMGVEFTQLSPQSRTLLARMLACNRVPGTSVAPASRGAHLAVVPPPPAELETPLRRERLGKLGRTAWRHLLGVAVGILLGWLLRGAEQPVLPTSPPTPSITDATPTPAGTDPSGGAPAATPAGQEPGKASLPVEEAGPVASSGEQASPPTEEPHIAALPAPDETQLDATPAPSPTTHPEPAPQRVAIASPAGRLPSTRERMERAKARQAASLPADLEPRLPPMLRWDDVVARIVGIQVSSRSPLVKACYERVLKRIPTLRGRVTVQLTINPTGRVRRAKLVENTLPENRVALCLQDRLRATRFPRLVEALTVEAPFDLKPLPPEL